MYIWTIGCFVATYFINLQLFYHSLLFGSAKRTQAPAHWTWALARVNSVTRIDIVLIRFCLGGLFIEPGFNREPSRVGSLEQQSSCVCVSISGAQCTQRCASSYAPRVADCQNATWCRMRWKLGWRRLVDGWGLLGWLDEALINPARCRRCTTTSSSSTSTAECCSIHTAVRPVAGRPVCLWKQFSLSMLGGFVFPLFSLNRCSLSVMSPALPPSFSLIHYQTHVFQTLLILIWINVHYSISRPFNTRTVCALLLTWNHCLCFTLRDRVVYYSCIFIAKTCR